MEVIDSLFKISSKLAAMSRKWVPADYFFQALLSADDPGL
jgi:hypothetical protein